MKSGLLLGTAAAVKVRLALRTYRLDEIEFLEAQGISFAEAVKQLGWTLGAAEIAARRDGRKELSSRMWAEMS